MGARHWRKPEDVQMEEDVRKGVETVHEIERLLPMAGRPDPAITSKLFLICKQNSDLMKAGMEDAVRAKIDRMPDVATLMALSMIEMQLHWCASLHMIYSGAGFSKEEFIRRCHLLPGGFPEIKEMLAEDDKLVESVDGLHDRVLEINDKLEAVLARTKNMLKKS